MIRLVTEEMPTSATKMRALKPSAGKNLLLSLLLAILPLQRRLRRPGGPVTDARDGLDDLRLGRIALDLGPEPADVDVYVAAGQVVRPRGDGLRDLGPRESLPRASHQQRQDLELRRRQVQQPPLPAHGVAVRVKLQRPEPDDAVAVLTLLPPEPAQYGFDPRQQLLGIKGLGYVVVRTELEADHLVHRLALRRQQHYRDVALLPHLLQDLEPAHPRQHDVQHDEVQRLPPEYPERLHPVLRRQHPISLRRQHDGRYLQERRVVVHQQDRFFQASGNLQANRVHRLQRYNPTLEAACSRSITPWPEAFVRAGPTPDSAAGARERVTPGMEANSRHLNLPHVFLNPQAAVFVVCRTTIYGTCAPLVTHLTAWDSPPAAPRWGYDGVDARIRPSTQPGTDLYPSEVEGGRG